MERNGTVCLFVNRVGSWLTLSVFQVDSCKRDEERVKFSTGKKWRMQRHVNKVNNGNKLLAGIENHLAGTFKGVG